MDPILATINVHIADGYKPLIFNIYSHLDYTQQIRIFVQKFCLPQSAVNEIRSQIQISLQKYEMYECERQFREKLNLMKEKIYTKTLFQPQQNIQPNKKTNELLKKVQLNNEDTPINKLWLNTVSKSKDCYKSKICFFDDMKNAQDKQMIRNTKQIKYSGLTFENYARKIGNKTLTTMGTKLNQNEVRQIQIFQQKGQKINNNYTNKQIIQLKQNKCQNKYKNRYSLHPAHFLSEQCSPQKTNKRETMLVLKKRYTQQLKQHV